MAMLVSLAFVVCVVSVKQTQTRTEHIKKTFE